MFIDTSVFGPVNGAKGQERILFPLEAANVRQRQRRYRPPKPPAIQGLLEQARQLKKRLDTTSRLNRFGLAKELGLDPSCITQILNLLNLAPAIRHYILTLPPTKHHSPIGDRHWMRLARIRDQSDQLNEFQRLLGSTKDEARLVLGASRP